MLVNGGQRIPEIRKYLERYVEGIEKGLQKRLSERVREAFLTVERHRFLEGFYRWEGPKLFTWVEVDHEAPDEAILKEIYSASPKGLPIKLSPEGYPTSSTTSPPLMAQMLELLELDRGMKVLEIGTGTGYNAALMAVIVGNQSLITTLEIQPDLVERTKRLLYKAGYGDIKVFCADGFAGWPENAPYDRIVATTCCADISPHWLKQLTDNGWALVPLYHGGETWAPLVRIASDGRGKVLCAAGFAHAQGGLSGHEIWSKGPKPTSLTCEPRQKLLRLSDRYEFVSFVTNFHFFIALNDLNACFPWLSPFDQAMLLWDDGSCKGAGLIFESDGWVSLVGSEPFQTRLMELYETYEEMGRPDIERYQVEFLVRSTALEKGNTPRLERVGSREWLIKRRYTVQRVWLP